jgi:hypothetical protein
MDRRINDGIHLFPDLLRSLADKRGDHSTEIYNPTIRFVYYVQRHF